VFRLKPRRAGVAESLMGLLFVLVPLLIVGKGAYDGFYEWVDIRYQPDLDQPRVYRVVDRPWPFRDKWTPLEWCEFQDPDYPDEPPQPGWCERKSDGSWWLDCCERPYCDPRFCPTK